MRDEFSINTKRIVAERVNYFCSNPECCAQTTGPQNDERKSLNVGVAAHICAASENGPRYDKMMTSEKRRGESNAIWLCQTCAKLIDSDLERFSVKVLRGWKEFAESKAFSKIGKAYTNEQEKSFFEIRIRRQHRTKIDFSLISKGTNHWIVNRLFLKYISEYEFSLDRWYTEAPLFQINYAITLSRKYSEYDIIPLTPDQDIHGFQYEGSDSDHFSISIKGTEVSIVQICADIYDVTNREQKIIESEKIQIVRDSSWIPNWDAPLPVETNRLLDDLQPISYKAISHLNYDKFLRGLDRFQIKKIKEDLIKFSSQLKSTINKPKRNRFFYFERLKTLYQLCKIVLNWGGMMWVPAPWKQLLLYGKNSYSRKALFFHIQKVLSEIDDILS